MRATADVVETQIDSRGNRVVTDALFYAKKFTKTSKNRWVMEGSETVWLLVSKEINVGTIAVFVNLTKMADDILHDRLSSDYFSVNLFDGDSEHSSKFCLTIASPSDYIMCAYVRSLDIFEE